ncbi:MULTISPECIES: sensor histidine kinase [unclassified Parafrankia]|uniref:sensor histidine kinase n=1 Tax=Parafrankia TaxID=2994362 RepID=UPI000DA52169|nr:MULTISPECIES: histidine kinase [unclassified Parafrankia]CAI7975939.1 two-component system, NarL family, sensor histidine kinase DesK [Frankia sp. Hr75.2]SQE00374.1 membrane hypothetical protein [Parafrankia sp. Ea1.12]
MTGWWRWWRERGSAERMDAITRWPLYLFSATEPGLVLLAISSRPGAWGLAAGGLLVVSALHAVACVVLLRAGLAAHLGGRRAAAPLIAGVAAGAVVLAAMGTAIPGFDADPGGGGMSVTLIVTMIAGGASTAAVTPLLRTPSLLACVVVGAAGCALIQAMVDAVAPAADVGPEVTPLQAAGYYAYPIVLVALTYRVSTWMLGVVWEIDRSRAVHTSLAVAEERLRFARDLHDVLGRNLSLMAVQSELAARLAEHGDAAAAERMLEVRQVAHDSLREMRAVVDGYRRADLGAELAGARALLRSAGVACQITGGVSRETLDRALPPSAQTALGWVVREATTNVIRHSAATTCTVDLDVRLGPGRARTAVLRITNDGVPPAAPGTASQHAPRPGAAPSPGPVAGPGPGPTAGSGLAGLGERLAGLGGVLSVARESGGCFVLEVRLAVPDDVSEGPVTAPRPAPTAAEAQP